MSERIYQDLANRLNTIPNGFPPTESGVEIRLLEKMFTPEQAVLANELHLTCMSSEEIAEKLDCNPGETHRQLKQMVRDGLIRADRSDGRLLFGLMPFVVGIYEEQIHRIDPELAELMEEYFQESQGALVTESPSIHRVIPVMEAIPFDLEIFAHDEARTLVTEAKAWGVRDCICRVQKQLINQPCEHPVENCLILAPVAGVFDNGKKTKAITKERAMEILVESEEAGLVHSTGNYQDHHHYICNCCTCSCGVLRHVAELDMPAAVAKSNFQAVVDVDICSGCEDCFESCQFTALSYPEFVAEVDHTRCVGCGLCVLDCSTGSMTLELRPEADRPSVPDNIKMWMAERAMSRGIDVSDII